MSSKTIKPMRLFLNGKELSPFQPEEVIIQVKEPVTDQVIGRIQQIMAAPKKKRLKKDCPCQKCCDWRKRRMAHRPKGIITFSTQIVDTHQVEKMRDAFYKNVGNQIFGAPSAPNPQTLPRPEAPKFGFAKIEEPKQNKINVSEVSFVSKKLGIY